MQRTAIRTSAATKSFAGEPELGPSSVACSPCKYRTDFGALSRIAVLLLTSLLKITMLVDAPGEDDGNQKKCSTPQHSWRAAPE